MPHGIAAIKEHLKTVDNVPLLVSLFTDSTPTTTKEMVKIFRENGEVVLTIGSGYRSNNHPIYTASDLATSVTMLPGILNHLPSTEEELLRNFPAFSTNGLCKTDLLLSFRLIGLGSLNLLQAPVIDRIRSLQQVNEENKKRMLDSINQEKSPLPVDLENPSAQYNDESKSGPIELSLLLEAIRKGRVIYLNMMQGLGFLCVANMSLALWPVFSNFVPIGLPPSIPPGIALLFSIVYIPVMALSLLGSDAPDGIMKNTPRKRIKSKRKEEDEYRFCCYLVMRSFFCAFSIFVIGWIVAEDLLKTGTNSFFNE